ncbi:MAG: hypothetical protein KGO05_07305 [Chloroflexota bacterium]|nr:hypothetical protein [Chloroflexota bacterium]
MDSYYVDRIVLMLVREQRLALSLEPADRWTTLYGELMLRVEFPSVARDTGRAGRDQARDLCESVFRCDSTALPTDWTYGPSARHAIDRQPAAAPDAPFLSDVRLVPPDAMTGAAPRAVMRELYRAAPLGGMAPDPEKSAGVLWLPIAALQTLLRGARAADALGLAGVELRSAAGVELLDDNVIYLPAALGERMLPRIAAKYGERALFATSQ